MRMYIDLSVNVNEQTPVYPGDAPVKIETAGRIERDGFNDHVVSINTHVGTHIDAPLHMIANGQTLDTMPVDQFVGRGVLITVDTKVSITAVEQAGIQAGDIVIFHTNTSKHYFETSYFDQYPALTDEIARYLVSQKVKMVGIDTCSVDNQDDFPVHKILLSSGVLVLENLTNLDKLVGKDFKIYALPIKFTLDAAPTRVLAEVS